MSASKSKLETLHEELTTVLTDRIKSEACTAADLGVAAKFLKDNNIVVSEGKDEDLIELERSMKAKRAERRNKLKTELESLDLNSSGYLQ